MPTTEHRVAGVVLAAGRSARMGRPKPLLPAGDRSFIAACVSALDRGGCDPVVAVAGGPEAGGDRAVAEAQRAGAVVVRNEAEDAEQIDSLRVGLRAVDDLAPGADAVLVLPVDHPRVRAGTVRALLDASALEPDAVLRPVHDGAPGHPTLFPRSVWSRLQDPALSGGARAVVESGSTTVRDVSVDDPGVLDDIDTPEGYRRVMEESL